MAALAEYDAHVKSLQELAARLAARSSGELKERAAALQTRHRQLAQRLLHVTRCVDALESRLAHTIGYVHYLDNNVSSMLGGVCPCDEVCLGIALEACQSGV